MAEQPNYVSSSPEVIPIPPPEGPPAATTLTLNPEPTHDPADKSEEVDEKEPPLTVPRALMIVSILLFFGMAQGFAFQTSGMTSPYTIRAQMTFKVWVVMKMFMGAVGGSMLVQSVMCYFDAERFHKTRVYMTTSAGFPRVIVGGAIVGIGIALCGSGPSMTPAQMGARVIDAVLTFAGLLVGGVVFSLAEPYVLNADISCRREEAPTLDRMFPKIGYIGFAVPFGTFMLIVALVLEIVIPQNEDAKDINVGRTPRLFPTIAGIVVAIGQLPMRLLFGKGQAGCVPLMNLLATGTCGKLAKAYQVHNIRDAAQIIYVYGGTLLGALIASYAVPDYDPPEGMGVWQSLVGGFLLIIGARIAAGCTCGNGVSGISELNIQSMVGVGAIFSFAIATGYILKAADVDSPTQ